MRTPPERLRVELQRQRDRGLSFRAAWPIGTSVAVADLSLASKIEWREVFNEQKRVWAANYTLLPTPAKQRPTLFTKDREHFERHAFVA